MAREKKRGSPQHVEETRRERPNSKNLDVRLRHRWLGKKIFRSSGKTRPFSERKRTLVCRRKSLAIFDGRRRKEKSWICLCPFGALDKSVIAQKIACDFLSDLRFFFSRKRKKFAFFLSEKRTFACRRKSQAIFDGRRRKEKSWICLCPFGALDKSVIAQKIACDFLSDLRFFFSRNRRKTRFFHTFFSRVFSGHRSSIDARREPLFLRFRYFFLFLVLFLSEKGRVFPELLRSRGKYRKRKKFAFFLSEKRTRNRKPVFFTEPYMARQKNLSHIWLGKKILAIYGSAKKSRVSSTS